MKQFLLFTVLMISANIYAQKAGKPCCTIIDMAKDSGIFTIRDFNTGKIASFKPDALDGAELKVGDTIDVKFDERKITAVKGASKSYDLIDANGDSCCVILKLDSTVNDTSWRIIAKNNSTGERIQFNVPKMLAARLNAGKVVFTKSSHGYAMITATEADTAKKQLYGFPLLQEDSK